MIIGCDLDGVAARYVQGLRAEVGSAFGLTPEQILAELPDPLDYGFTNWKIIGDKFKEYHTNAVDAGLYAKLEAFEGASKVLWQLSDEGYYIRIITSRFVKHGQNAKVVADTAIWLDKNDIPYRGLDFEKNKTEVFADIYIDDAPMNIDAFHAKGKKVIVFDAPYNQDTEDFGLRAYNWDDVLRLIHENAPLVAA